MTTAIQLDPEFAEAYAYRGLAHYRLGNYDAAMQDYDTAVTLSPDLAEPYYFRAILHGQRKDHENAIDDYFGLENDSAEPRRHVASFVPGRVGTSGGSRPGD